MKASCLASFRLKALPVALLTIFLGAWGCSGSSSPGLPNGPGRGSGRPPPSASPAPSSGPRSGKYIKHVVLMIQENRSFDDYFSTFPGVDGATHGAMKTARGVIQVPLKKAGFDSDDLSHAHYSFELEYDHGRMDGFNLVTRGQKGQAGTYTYRVVAPEYIKPYWALARQYVLADHMFMTQGSDSFTAHQDLIAGDTTVNKEGDNVIDFPTPASWGCNAAPGTVTSLITPSGRYLRDQGPFPCFTYATLRDLLDAKRLSWLYFTNNTSFYLWSAFDAIKVVREGPEWQTNIVRSPPAIFKTISDGKLPAVSWVIPNAGYSDHPGSDPGRGPSWIASVVNAIGESPYWDSTVVIVVWDDWGGEYDNVAPPQLDGQGLGMRVPMLLVSAYARKSRNHPGYVSHTQYEFGSILKFIEENWKLGSLHATDARANSLIDCFDFTQAPRRFTRIPTDFSRSYFERLPPSDAPVDTY
jgi:phospholipase C